MTKFFMISLLSFLFFSKASFSNTDCESDKVKVSCKDIESTIHDFVCVEEKKTKTKNKTHIKNLCKIKNSKDSDYSKEPGPSAHATSVPVIDLDAVPSTVKNNELNRLLEQIRFQILEKKLEDPPPPLDNGEGESRKKYCITGIAGWEQNLRERIFFRRNRLKKLYVVQKIAACKEDVDEAIKGTNLDSVHNCSLDEIRKKTEKTSLNCVAKYVFQTQVEHGFSCKGNWDVEVGEEDQNFSIFKGRKEISKLGFSPPSFESYRKDQFVALEALKFVLEKRKQ